MAKSGNGNPSSSESAKVASGKVQSESANKGQIVQGNKAASSSDASAKELGALSPSTGGNGGGSNQSVNLGKSLSQLNQQQEVVVSIELGAKNPFVISLPESETVKVTLHPAQNRAVLKGSVGDIQKLLGSAEVTKGIEGKIVKSVKLQIEVEDDGGSLLTRSKVNLMYDADSGYYVPRYKIGSDTLTEEVVRESYRFDHTDSFGHQAFQHNVVEEDNPFLYGSQSEQALGGGSSHSFAPPSFVLNSDQITPPTPPKPVDPTPPTPPKPVDPTPPTPNPPSPPTPPANTAPTLASAQADLAINAGAAFNLDITTRFTDADADPLTYTATLNGGGALPSWLSFDPATGLFSGTPTIADGGTITVIVTASDGVSGSITDTFDISVGQAPALDTAEVDQFIQSGSAFSLNIAGNFSDPDAHALTYTATLNGGGALPSWLSFNATTGAFSGTPAAGDAGAITVVVTASDPTGLSITDSFLIDVNAITTLGSAQSDQIAQTGSAYALNVSGNFTNPDSDTLTYTATLNGGGALPSWLSFNASTGAFSGTPTAGDAGTITVVVTANDGNGSTVSDTFDLFVNRPLTLGSAQADQTAQTGSAYALNVSGNFTNPDADTVTYTATLSGGGTLPAWLTFNTTTGAFSGTPAVGDAGTIAVLVTANDGHGSTVSDTFDVLVNRPTTLSSAQSDQTAQTGAAYSLNVSSNFADADSHTLTYTATLDGGGALPSWLSFNSATGAFTGTPAVGDAGTISVKVTANDGHGSTVSDTFDVLVNRPATLSSAQSDQIAQTGTAYTLNVSGNFSDADSHTLTYTATLNGGGALPSWLSFNSTTGAFTGTPAAGDAAVLSVVVTANDGHGTTANDTFDLRINRPVTLATPQPDLIIQTSAAFNLDVGSHFADADGGTLTYNATKANGTALPSWLTFNTATGAFSGTPAVGDAANLSILVTVSDGYGSSVTDSFDVVVNAPPVGATITEKAADINTAYTQNIASNFTDANGHSLTYTATLANGSALPAWLSFNGTTGAFSGTPVSGNIGAMDIKVTANDGYGGSTSLIFHFVVDDFAAILTNDPDTITAFPSGQRLFGSDSADTVSGNTGSDTFYGGDGNDSLFGAAGNDSLLGGDGQDILEGGLGADTLTGGADADIFRFAISSAAQPSVSGTMDIVTDFVQGTDKIEFRYGVNGIGAEVDQLIITYDAGNDRTVVTNTALGLQFALSGNIALTNSDFLFYNREGVLLSLLSGNDTIYGSASIDIINGGAGDDFIMRDTNTYNDTIFGGAGNDSLNGGGGSDVIYGGAGNDTIDGAAGRDTMTGGAGADVFRFVASNQSPSANPDLITDFVVGTDKIDLRFGISAIGNDLDEISITYDAGNNRTVIANTTFDLLIYLTGNIALTASDFLFLESDGTALSVRSGNDTIYSGVNETYIFGGAGDDMILRGSNLASTTATLVGGAGNDSIIGSSQAETILGDDGNDTIEGGGGRDTMRGGNGVDIFRFQYAADSPTATPDLISDFQDGTDKIDLRLGFSGIGSGMDQITVTYDAGNNRMVISNTTFGFTLYVTGNLTLDASDFIFGNSNGTIIDDLTGNDVMLGQPQPERLNGGAGNDLINRTGGNQSVLFGGTGNDSLIGTSNADTLIGGDGDDVLEGQAQGDILYGGAGADIFLYNSMSYSITTQTDVIQDFVVGTDKISARGFSGIGTGDDLLTVTYDSANNRTVVANSGLTFQIYLTGNIALTASDFIFSNSDGTLLSALTGNDSLVGATGGGLINGGDGNDVITRSSVSSPDTVFGGNGNDSITGSQGADRIFGGAGADTIEGGTGSDTITGGAGVDYFLYTGTTQSSTSSRDLITDFTVGTDKIAFAAGMGITGIGAGANQITITSSGGFTYVTLNSTTFQIQLTGTLSLNASNFVFSNLNIDGTAAADTLTGTASADVINGAAGNDVVYGGNGNDTLSGSSSNDTIYGENNDDMLFGDGHADVLDGGAGNDTLDGGTGPDTLTGGIGNDVFVFTVAEGAAANINLITDFVVGTDKIMIQAGFNGLGSGVDKLTVTYDAGNNRTVVESLTSGAQPFTLYLTGNIALTSTDFIFANSDGTLISSLSGDNNIQIGANGYGYNGGVSYIHLDSGNDVLFRNDGGADAIFGGNGNDSVFSGAGRDVLYGGDGADTLRGGQDADTLHGGDGADIFQYLEIDFTGGSSSYDTILDFVRGTDKIYFGVGISGIGTGDDQITITYDAGNNRTVVTHSQQAGALYVSGNVALDATDFIFANSDGTLISSLSGSETIYGGLRTERINGGDGNDTIIRQESGGFQDMLWGGAGHDYINSGDGTDTIFGGDGNDTLDGGSNRDTLYGGNGADVFRIHFGQSPFASGDVISDFVKGTDKIELRVGINGIGAREDQLTITYDSANNRMVVTNAALGLGFFVNGNIALDASDFIFANYDGVTMDSLTGNDTLGSVFASGIPWNGGAGDDVLNILPNAGDTIFGGDGNDYIMSNNQSDLVYGGAGNDTIDSGSHGVDTVYGGTGADVFLYTAYIANTHYDMIQDFEVGVDKIELRLGISGIGTGEDELNIAYDSGNNRTVITTNNLYNLTIYLAGNVAITANDFIFRNSTNIIISDMAGNDLIYAPPPNNYINAGAGNDIVYSEMNSKDLFFGGAGNDTIYGAIWEDTIYGGAGDDFIDGGTHGDSLYGGAGNDTIDPGLNQDTVYGGAGNDVFRFSYVTHSSTGTADLIADFARGSDKIELRIGVSGIGTDVDLVTVTYDAGNNRTVVASTTLGFQLYISGNHALDATDFIFANYDGTLINSLTGNDSVAGSPFQENINLGAGNDIIMRDTNQFNDLLFGGAGNDTIFAGSATDTVYGGDGNDSLDGGDHADTIYGGAGNDSINGSQANDSLYGGTGADIFYFNQNANSSDRIADMEAADSFIFSDVAFVFKSGEGAKNGVTMTLNTDIFTVGANFSGGNFAAGSGATFLYDTTDGQVWYDRDGNTSATYTGVLLFTIDNFASYTFDINDFVGGL